MTDTAKSTTGDNLPAPTGDAELAAFAEYAKGLVSEDSEVVQERILRNLLRATTAEDVLNSGAAVPAEAVYDVPIRVLDIRAGDSEYEDGPEQFLHIDCVTIGNGDTLTVSCGARDVVMKLVRLHQLGMLPIDCVIYRSTKRTAAGYYPVFLRASMPNGNAEGAKVPVTTVGPSEGDPNPF